MSIFYFFARAFSTRCLFLGFENFLLNGFFFVSFLNLFCFLFVMVVFGLADLTFFPRVSFPGVFSLVGFIVAFFLLIFVYFFVSSRWKGGLKKKVLALFVALVISGSVFFVFVVYDYSYALSSYRSNHSHLPWNCMSTALNCHFLLSNLNSSDEVFSANKQACLQECQEYCGNLKYFHLSSNCSGVYSSVVDACANGSSECIVY